MEPAVFDGAMCYDAARGYCLSSGGLARWNVATNKTHTWDGERWLERECIWPVENFAGAAMAYDSKRGVAVMFGGADYNRTPLDYTWEWSGNGWSNSSSEPPPGRTGHCMAYDKRRAVTVMFGGSAFGQPAMLDVWEWDGEHWKCIKQEEGEPHPDPLRGAMAYDSLRERCVYFGGRPSNGQSDTWTWDGASWREESCEETPGERNWFAMAFDSERNSVVLVGEGTGGDRDKTWEYKGSTWRRIDCSGPAFCVEHHSLAYDARRNRLVLHGGNKHGGGRDDTWEFDGQEWLECTRIVTPRPDGEAALFYDSARKRAYLLGVDWDQPVNGGFARCMWSWDGKAWTQVRCKHMPPRGEPAIAFDERRGVAVCLLCTGDSGSRYVESWEFDGFDWRQAGRDPLVSRFGDLIVMRYAMEPAFYDPEIGEVFTQICMESDDFKPGHMLWQSWNGKRWKKRAECVCPNSPEVINYAYDDDRRTLLLLGSSREAGYQTFEYDWRVLRQVASPTGPSLTLGGRTLCANPATGRTICFGCGIVTDEQFSFDWHWEWDGAMWHQPVLLVKPSPRSRAHMCYDTDRQSILLFGGHADGVELFDTWEYGPDN